MASDCPATLVFPEILEPIGRQSGVSDGGHDRAKLRWLQAPQAAPPAGYYYPELIAHSVVVTNFREIFNDHIGAHILAFVLAFARGLHVFIPQQFRREWKKRPAESGDVVHLPEATALIVGVRGIGSEAARLLSAFGVTVLGTDARRTTAPDGVAELHRPEALDELLLRADFVILTVPHTPVTEGFFDRPRFQRIKPTAFFVNIGRGMTTKLDDLVTALEAGEIAGAAPARLEGEPAVGADLRHHRRAASRARRVCHSLQRNLARRPARLSYSSPSASRSMPA